jgi:hypothetical protein
VTLNLILIVISHGLLSDPEDGGGMFFRNVSKFVSDYTASQP